MSERTGQGLRRAAASQAQQMCLHPAATHPFTEIRGAHDWFLRSTPCSVCLATFLFPYPPSERVDKQAVRLFGFGES